MYRWFVATSVALLVGCAAGPSTGYKKVPPQDAEQFQKEMCEKVACIYDTRIVLKQKDGATFDKTFPTLPTVQPNGVAVYAGQTVLFEADEEGDHLTNFRVVTAGKSTGKEFSATLKQAEAGYMTLALKNPYDRAIKIDMGIMPLDREDLLKTSSCPLSAGGGSNELWPYPVFQVWLGEMRFLKEGDSVICE